MTVIANYGQLKTAIAGKVNRSDLTTHLPGFVQRAEEEFNRELRQLSNLYRYENFPFSAEYTAVPNDWQEAVAIELDLAGGRRRIELISPALANRYMNDAGGDPQGFMLVNDQIRLLPAPSSAITGDLLYYRGVTTITSGDTADNWLLLKHSAVYLWRSCMEASIHMKNDADIQRFGAAYQAAMQSVLRAGRRRRQSSEMRVRLG